MGGVRMRINHVPDKPPTVSGASRHPRADPLLIEPKAAPAAVEVRIAWMDTHVGPLGGNGGRNSARMINSRGGRTITEGSMRTL